MPPIQLRIESQASPGQRQELHYELTDELARMPGIQTAPSPRPRPPIDGVRGDAASIGDIALAILSAGGVATSLVGCLRAYLVRDRELRFTLTSEAGTTVSLDAKNVAAGEIEATIAAVERLLNKG